MANGWDATIRCGQSTFLINVTRPARVVFSDMTVMYNAVNDRYEVDLSYISDPAQQHPGTDLLDSGVRTPGPVDFAIDFYLDGAQPTGELRPRGTCP